MFETQDRIPVVSIGRIERAEFALCRAILRDEIASEIQEVVTVDEWLQRDESTPPAELIVMWQSFPDEYSLAGLTQLLAHFPLAAIICLQGAWCGSDGRTRPGWPVAVRVPLEEGPLRLRGLRDALVGRFAALPLTASREEAWIWDTSLLFDDCPTNNDRSPSGMLSSGIPVNGRIPLPT